MDRYISDNLVSRTYTSKRQWTGHLSVYLAVPAHAARSARFSCSLFVAVSTWLGSSVTTLPKPWACVSKNLTSTSIEAVEGVGVTEAVVHVIDAGLEQDDR